jgi:hypothetical protein
MPRATWSLRQGSPSIRVVLTLVAGGRPLPLFLLADTGAGKDTSPFELILEESDCLLCGGQGSATIRLTGAYAGQYMCYRLHVQVPELGFDAPVPVVGVPANLSGFEGVAAFRFLNRFSYGNFGNPAEFGLES